MKPSTARTFYACAACGSVFAKWQGQCPDCGTWNSVHEEKNAVTAGGAGRAGKRKKAPEATLLSSISTDTMAVLATGISELDTVLGGGASPGSTVLVGGEPGIGKSTLMLQAAGRLAHRGYDTLYVSGEESASQIKRRADRLAIRPEGLSLLTDTDVTAILAAAEKTKPRALIVDSIQTTFDPELQSPPGTVSQIRECASRFSDWARSNDAVAFLIGHVTKDGFIAGPKVLEHLVDTVLQFEGDRRQWIRILRCLKNRYGSTHEVGLFEMTEQGLVEIDNPSAHFLSERSPEAPGSAIAVAIEGRRPLLLEVQALVGQGGGIPQRVMSGLDPRRSAILIAILQNAAGLQLAGRDVYLNLAGGYATDEPAVDLAAAVAIASAALKRPVPSDTVFIGEVGLAGEIRSVTQIVPRLSEAEKLGFRSAVIPTVNMRDLSFAGDLAVSGIRRIEQALQLI